MIPCSSVGAGDTCAGRHDATVGDEVPDQTAAKLLHTGDTPQ